MTAVAYRTGDDGAADGAALAGGAYFGEAGGGPTARRFRFAPLLAATILTVLLLWLFGTVADVLLLLFIAVLVSLYLGALAGVIGRRLRVPRGAALAVAGLLTLGAITALLWLLVPPVIEQTQALVRVFPRYVNAWDEGVDRLVVRAPGLSSVWQPGHHNLAITLYEQGASFLSGMLPRVFSVVHASINVVSVAVMAIYLSLRPVFYREQLIAYFPPVHRGLVRDILGDVAGQLRSWIVGQLTAMVVLAVLTAFGLYLLGVPYWLTFGVFTGAVAIVPFFGTLLSTVLPAAFVLALPDGGTRALLVLGLGVVIHLIEGNFVGPMIASRRVEIPPVLSILSVLIIGKLLGGVGLLVAVPTVATLRVVVNRILLQRMYEGRGFRRAPRDQPLVVRVPAADGDGVFVPDAGQVDLIAIAERRVRAAA
ncbi:AI-2E family transporter [Gemmatimonadetes bacterium T265]|nr:AI-2E family transporter [Gemmatimonadetes bacterium T265]